MHSRGDAAPRLMVLRAPLGGCCSLSPLEDPSGTPKPELQLRIKGLQPTAAEPSASLHGALQLHGPPRGFESCQI